MRTVGAPLELIEALAEFRFPEKLDGHLRELMDRNTEGQLSEAQRKDLEALVELSERMALLRGQALRLLGRKPV